MREKYIVRLNKEEREALLKILNQGTTSAFKIRHANILIKADADGPNWHDEQIAEAFNCHLNSVANVRKRFVESGIESALERGKQDRISKQRSLDGAQEARLIAMACGKAPHGRASWSLRLLSERLVELEIVDEISHETVRSVLKKMNLNPI